MSTYSIPTNINGRPPQPVDLGWSADIRFDPDANTPTYIGLHITKGAATTDPNWKIYKFTGTNVTEIQLAYGAWDSRGSIF